MFDLHETASYYFLLVTAEGTALVKQAEDAASTKKADKKDVAGMQEQVFVRKVIELHDKYLAYVNDCFQNHTLFHKSKFPSLSMVYESLKALPEFLAATPERQHDYVH